MAKIWFITGVSRGFGRLWAEAALERGDSVAATARDVKTLAPLVEKYGDRILPIALDVTDRAADFSAVAAAHAKFGRLDIVINNAGYGQFGAVEELSEAEARAQLETNLFGALWISQAAMPIMRAQKSGHIIQVSSIGGVVAFANVGIYHASKWGLEGFSEAMAIELAPFGVHVTLVEPAGFSTDWGGASAKHAAPNPAYESVRAARTERMKSNVQGEPEGSVKAILALVDAPEPPLRLLLGSAAVRFATARYAERLETWKAWEAVSNAADKA
jgi:NAD(P)-dependent dehydrogenase (short-subunit alcohol dehydrogenase family)